MVVGGASDERRLKQRLELQVHQSRSHLSALQRPADFEELPSSVVRQGCVGHTEKAMATELHCIAETVWAAGDLLHRIKPRHGVIQPVDVLPHLTRNAVADGARILACFGDALDN